MEKLKLKCIDCGGSLEVDPTRKIISCPYCESKQLMIDSDEVKIAEIKAKTYETVEKLKSNNEVEKERIKHKTRLSEDNIHTIIVLVFMLILLLFTTFMF